MYLSRDLLLQEAINLLELLDGILVMINCYLALDTVHIVKDLHQILADFHGNQIQWNIVTFLPFTTSDSLLALPDVDIQDRISLACEKWCVTKLTIIIIGFLVQ